MHTAAYIYEAVFEHGVFRVLTPQDIRIPEGQAVRLVIETVESPEEILKLATQVYEGLSAEEIQEIKQELQG